MIKYSRIWVQLPFAASLLSGVVITPLLYRSLGPEDYGSYLFYFQIFGYTSLITGAITPQFVRTLSAASQRENSVVFSRYCGVLALGLVVASFLTLAVIRLWMPHFAGSLAAAMFLTLAFASFASFLSLYYFAGSRFLMFGLLEAIPTLLTVLLVGVQYAVGSMTLKRVVLIVLCVSVGKTLFLSYSLRQLWDHTAFRGFFPWLREEWLRLRHFVSMNLGAFLIFQSNGIIAGWVLGPIAVTQIVVQNKIAAVIQGMMWSYEDSYYPRLASKYPDAGEVFRSEAATGIRRVMLAGILGLMAFGFMNAYVFRLWMGGGFPFDSTVNWLLHGFVCLYGVSHFLGVIVNAKRLEHVFSKYVLIEGGGSLVLGIFLAKTYGVVGLLVSGLIAHLVIGLPVLLRLTRPEIRLALGRGRH